MPAQTPLPIDAYLSEIARALATSNSMILVAPPGTGKTTRVAPSLLDGDVARKVLLVQPRRIAARASAARIAHECESALGQEVGYQIRFESRVSKQTQLICMTPGVLLRRLQSDSVLHDVATVILDEFHERSVEYDLLLGMLRRIQTQLRDDLRIVIMSATMDRELVGAYLKEAPQISIEANAYPVRIEYARFNPQLSRERHKGGSRRIIEQTVEAILLATATHEGDVLAFLPGVGEINQVFSRLEITAEKKRWKLLTLFGEMRSEDQDQVLQLSDRRKVILATNIAETSLTIDGVTIVVDCGWARVQRIDPALGLNRLVLEPISQASAVQRAGRAGRTAPGVCYRLWDEITGRSRPEQLDPEVFRVDLSGAVLQLLCWGEDDLNDFPWVTQPHVTSLESALRTLDYIGASKLGKVTQLGRQLLGIPVHPRLARMLFEGHRLGIPRQAALAAAILSERDVINREHRGAHRRSSGADHCDISRRVLDVEHALQSPSESIRSAHLNMPAVRHVQRVAEQLLKSITSQFGGTREQVLGEELQRALLAAFPDRLAKRRSATSDRGVMVGGRGVRLDASSSVTRAELFLCLDVDAQGSEATVRIATAIEADWLSGEHLRSLDEKFFNPTLNAVVTRRRSYWGDLMLSESPVETIVDSETAKLLAKAGAARFDKLLPAKDKVLRCWLDRLQWLGAAMPDAGLPKLDASSIEFWLENWCFGFRTIEELKQLPWSSLLPSVLDPTQRQMLQMHAPESVTLPSGRQALLQYEVEKPPVLAARIQEFFGWSETPRLAGGRVKLLLHLLAPNGRCHQITDDLASFWKNTYPHVRKELRGRYPKHAWPENPLKPNA